MALTDINKNPINIGGCSVTFIEDERLQEFKKFCRDGLISHKDFMHYYCAFPFQIVIDPAVPEEPEPITSRFDILDIR